MSGTPWRPDGFADYSIGEVLIFQSPVVRPGQPTIGVDVAAARPALFVAVPSPWATQVWDALHERLPWIQGGQDPLTRAVHGIHQTTRLEVAS